MNEISIDITAIAPKEVGTLAVWSLMIGTAVLGRAMTLLTQSCLVSSLASASNGGRAPFSKLSKDDADAEEEEEEDDDEEQEEEDELEEDCMSILQNILPEVASSVRPKLAVAISSAAVALNKIPRHHLEMLFEAVMGRTPGVELKELNELSFTIAYQGLTDHHGVAGKALQTLIKTKHLDARDIDFSISDHDSSLEEDRGLDEENEENDENSEEEDGDDNDDIKDIHKTSHHPSARNMHRWLDNKKVEPSTHQPPTQETHKTKLDRTTTEVPRRSHRLFKKMMNQSHPLNENQDETDDTYDDDDDEEEDDYKPTENSDGEDDGSDDDEEGYENDDDEIQNLSQEEEDDERDSSHVSGSPNTSTTSSGASLSPDSKLTGADYLRVRRGGGKVFDVNAWRVRHASRDLIIQEVNERKSKRDQDEALLEASRKASLQARYRIKTQYHGRDVDDDVDDDESKHGSDRKVFQLHYDHRNDEYGCTESESVEGEEEEDDDEGAEDGENGEYQSNHKEEEEEEDKEDNQQRRSSLGAVGIRVLGTRGYKILASLRKGTKEPLDHSADNHHYTEYNNTYHNHHHIHHNNVFQQVDPKVSIHELTRSHPVQRQEIRTVRSSNSWRGSNKINKENKRTSPEDLVNNNNNNNLKSNGHIRRNSFNHFSNKKDIQNDIQNDKENIRKDDKKKSNAWWSSIRSTNKSESLSKKAVSERVDWEMEKATLLLELNDREKKLVMTFTDRNNFRAAVSALKKMRGDSSGSTNSETHQRGVGL